MFPVGFRAGLRRETRASNQARGDVRVTRAPPPDWLPRPCTPWGGLACLARWPTPVGLMVAGIPLAVKGSAE
jgi:hypothetical protein